jgi:hypothetical protein
MIRIIQDPPCDVDLTQYAKKTQQPEVLSYTQRAEKIAFASFKLIKCIFTAMCKSTYLTLYGTKLFSMHNLLIHNQMQH